ncbi:hypothetical protein HJFPF1_05465 [Paramyrothecium foliicola]|nr:hypothetical protein HJFPF1_05465 [Paramyrothecium foliicola]
MEMVRKLRLDILQPDSLEDVSEFHMITPSNVKLKPTKKGHHALGLYQDRFPVLVEWMWFTDAANHAAPLQRSLVNGTSRGKAGFGFVYQYPDGAVSHPTTVLQYLAQGDNNLEHQPLPGDKFKLAFALADFLKGFHTIGWLHENLNSHNILFFKPVPPSGNDRSTKDITLCELGQPLLVGLHKSKPDGDFWQTDGPADDDILQNYQHPDCASARRYRLAFDYYSLGVILPEIGLWRPLKSLLSSPKLDNMGLAQTRKELEKQCRTHLGAKMGAACREAVLRCLNADQVEKPTRHVEESYALRTLTEEVVEPLRKLAMASI